MIEVRLVDFPYKGVTTAGYFNDFAKLADAV